jgi:2-oxoglutarate ferredoxin oxidoreductase subunit beta
MQNPNSLLILNHPDGIQAGETISKIYKNQVEHDPSNLHKAREYASLEGQLAVGILYRNEHIPCYEEVRKPKKMFTPADKKAALEQEFDKFGIFPQTYRKGPPSENNR